MKRQAGTWEYDWASLSLGTDPSGWAMGDGSRLGNFLFKKVEMNAG
jgi:hypothetical protein